ncbi:MAG: T9SS type A sorting domain-containing protein, partial [Bacteroidota bacterium]
VLMRILLFLFLFIPITIIGKQNNQVLAVSDNDKISDEIYEYVNGSWVKKYWANYYYGGSSLGMYTKIVPSSGYINYLIYDGNNLIRNLSTISNYPGNKSPTTVIDKDTITILSEYTYKYKNSLMILSTSLVYGGSFDQYSMKRTSELNYTDFDSVETIFNYTYVDGFGTYPNGRLDNSTRKTYNADKKPALSIQSSGTSKDTIRYIYSSTGMLQEEYSSSNATKTLYEYDVDNNLISEILYRQNSNKEFIQSFKNTYEYNEKKLISKKQHWKWIDSTQTWEPGIGGIYEYYYDSENRLIEVIYSEWRKKIVTKDNDDELLGEFSPKQKWVYNYSSPSSIENEIENSLSLAVHPNPLKEGSTISYAFLHDGLLKITLHDIFGREIAIIHNDFENAGSHTIPFKNENLPNGIYFLKMNAGGQVVTKSVNILR